MPRARCVQARPLPALFRAGEEGGHLRLAKGEQVFDTLAVRCETGGAVEAVHGAVEGRVGGAQIGGHQVVECGERGTWMGGAGVEDGPGEGEQRWCAVRLRYSDRHDLGNQSIPSDAEFCRDVWQGQQTDDLCSKRLPTRRTDESEKRVDPILD